MRPVSSVSSRLSAKLANRGNLDATLSALFSSRSRSRDLASVSFGSTAHRNAVNRSYRLTQVSETIRFGTVISVPFNVVLGLI